MKNLSAKEAPSQKARDCEPWRKLASSRAEELITPSLPRKWKLTARTAGGAVAEFVEHTMAGARSWRERT
jgi:hypothetical protein